MLRDATELRIKREADAGEPCWENGREERCAATLEEVYTGGLATLLGAGSACDVPLVRARTCTGIKRHTVGIFGLTVCLAFFLALVGFPFYRKAKKRTVGLLTFASSFSGMPFAAFLSSWFHVDLTRVCFCLPPILCAFVCCLLVLAAIYATTGLLVCCMMALSRQTLRYRPPVSLLCSHSWA